MSDALAPDHALQGWRDQIDENNRLRQVIEDQRGQVEELARLNHDALFEANRYKSLFDIATADGKYQTRVADQRAAALDALASVATDMARSLTSFAGRCIDAARADVALPPQQLPPIVPAAPPTPPATPAIPPIDKPRPVAGPEDGVTDLPIFLQPAADAAHVTPLPTVTP